MRIKEELARLQLQNLEELVRTIVREEISKAFSALAREAEHQDMPYETGELEASALGALKRVAEGTVTRLTCEHKTYRSHYSESRCSWCGEPEEIPANPFEDGGRTRRCPVGPDICGEITGWEALCAHIYETHTDPAQSENARRAEVQRIMEGRNRG